MPEPSFRENGKPATPIETGNPAAPVPEPTGSRCRPSCKRALLPLWLLLCAGVLALFSYAVWDNLQPVAKVHAVPALSWKDGMVTHGFPASAAALVAPLPGPAKGVVVDASPTVFIDSQLDGVVDAVYVKEGDVVRRGQPLVRLADDGWQCARTRLFGLWKEQEAAEASGTQAAGPGDSAALLGRAYACVDAMCSRTTISSPAEGVVRRVHVAPGNVVRAGRGQGVPEEVALMELRAGNALALTVPMAPAEAFRVGVPRSVRVTWSDLPEAAPTDASIAEWKGWAVKGSNAFEARVPLAGVVPAELKPGMHARVEFLENEREQELHGVALIPCAALLPPGNARANAGEGTTVASGKRAGQSGKVAFWVIGADNRLQKRQAERRPEWDAPGQCAVLGGVRPGEPVVIEPAADLKEGLHVATE